MPRQYPPPRGPWLMAQTWHDLLFAHWPVDADQLRVLVPRQLELDTFDGQAWLGVVPFRMSGVRARWTPALPSISAFLELNVRTYVRVGGRPGVYFFSLDAANRLAVLAARQVLGLPYFLADMSMREQAGWLLYRARRTHADAPVAELQARYAPAGPRFHARSGSIESFLTDRYCLYTPSTRIDIDHDPWPLQPAVAEFERNSMAEAAGLRLPPTRPLLYFTPRLHVRVWPPVRLPD